MVIQSTSIGRELAQKHNISDKVIRLQLKVPTLFGASEGELGSHLSSFGTVPIYSKKKECQFCGEPGLVWLTEHTAPGAMRLQKQVFCLRGKAYLDGSGSVLRDFVCCFKVCQKCYIKHASCWGVKPMSTPRGWDNETWYAIAPTGPFFMSTEQSAWQKSLLNKFEYKLFQDQITFNSQECFFASWDNEMSRNDVCTPCDDEVRDGAIKRFRDAYLQYTLLSFMVDMGDRLQDIIVSNSIDVQIETAWPRLQARFVMRAQELARHLPEVERRTVICDGIEKLHRPLCNCHWYEEDRSEHLQATLITHCKNSPAHSKTDVCSLHEKYSFVLHGKRWIEESKKSTDPKWHLVWYYKFARGNNSF